jgi:hypothetical protein
MGTASERDHVADRHRGKGGTFGLRNVAHDAPEIARTPVAHVAAVEKTPSLRPGKESQNRAKKRRLSGAVGAENRENALGFKGEMNVRENGGRGFAAGGGPRVEGVFRAERVGHRAAPCVRRKRRMKKGAPITAVRIETGISASLAVLASVSTTSMKSAPRIIEAGST